MTVPTTTNTAIGEGNGVATVFPFTFGTLPAGNLVVTLFDTDGNEIPQTIITDYTVLGAGAEDGGSVVFVVPPASGYVVLIQRIIPETQPDDLKNQGSYYPRTVERMFDRVTMLIQQLSEIIGRTLTLPPQVQGVSTQLPAPEPLNLIGWDATSTALRNFTVSDIGTTLAFSNFIADQFTATPGQTVFNLTADPGALANLDVSIDGVTQRPFTDYVYLGTALTFLSPMAGGENVLARYGTALPTGITDTNAILYTPPSTGILGTMTSFLDSLWTASASAGGALIRFLQVGVGAIARTLQDKLNEHTSVTDFMSAAERADIKLANPLLDHTVSVQKAFTAAALGAADSRVKFPRGKFNISGELLAQFSGVIYGAGTQDTIIRTTHATNNLISTVGSFGCLAIRDLQINTTVTRTGGAAIFVNTTLPGDGAQARLLVNNVAIYSQYKGIEILNAGYWHITKNWFYDCVQYGVYADCTSNFDNGDNSIEGNLFTAGNTSCEHVRLINNCRVLNNKMLGGAKGVHVEPSAAPGTRVDFQIFKNSIENQATHGIHFQVNAAGVGIANSQINDNQIAAFQAGSQCIAINGPVGGLTISDNLTSLIGVNSAGIAMVGNAFGAPGTINVADNVVTGGPAGSIGIYCGGSGVVLDNNLVPSANTRVQVAAAGTVIRNMDATFAEITAWAAGGISNGSVVYCSNGTIANPVAGAGTGCIAKRLNGVWVGN